MPDVLVPAALVSEWTVGALVRILGFGLYACLTALGVAFLYRTYTTRAIPSGVAALVGVSIVALSLNIDAIVREQVIGGVTLFDRATAVYLLGVGVVSAVAADLGRRAGDRFACDVSAIPRLTASGEAARLVGAARLVVSLDLPEEVDDLDGYPAVAEAEKRRLEGREMAFPRRLSDEELAERLAARIERDFDVGRVHVDLAGGSVADLAVGRRTTGIEPSLPSHSVAVAVRADPSPDASSGDPVEVWTADRPSRLVATGTFRAANGSVATITVDAEDAETFDCAGTYRLATRPDNAANTAELVSLLRDATDTVTSVTVSDGGPLEGEFVGWLPTTVLVVERDGGLVPLPEENETLAAGDRVHVVGTPAQLHALSEYDPERTGEVPEDVDARASTDDGRGETGSRATAVDD